MNAKEDTLIEITPINTKSVGDFDKKAVMLTENIAKLSIKSQEDYESAAGLRKTLKSMASDLETERKKIVDPLNQVKEAVQNLFNPIKLRLENSVRHVDSLLVDYTNRKERERKDAEEKLRRAAEAEENRKKKVLEERAKKADAEGNAEKAEELRQKKDEVFVPAPSVAPSVQKVSGLSYREDWSAEITDLMDLVIAVYEGKAPINFLMADMKVLNQQASASKNSLVFPGVKFNVKKVPVGR